jgi:hypothetical protein
MGGFGELLPALVYFFPIDKNLKGGFDAQADSVALDILDADANVAVDDDAFSKSACQNQHDNPSVKMAVGFLRTNPSALVAATLGTGRSNKAGPAGTAPRRPIIGRQRAKKNPSGAALRTGGLP